MKNALLRVYEYILINGSYKVELTEWCIRLRLRKLMNGVIVFVSVEVYEVIVSAPSASRS